MQTTKAIADNTTYLPNLIIGGVPKAATSSLFRWLADHPDALGSSVKETRYFVDRTSHTFDPDMNIATQDLDTYRQFFTAPATQAPPKLVLEATPTYLYEHTALEYLPDLASHPVMLFILRRPSAQIYSTYTYFTNNHIYMDPSIDFPRFVELARDYAPELDRNELLQNALDNCRYAEHLEKWRRRIGPERMIVLLFEDLIRDPKSILKTIAGRLGIDPSFYDQYDFPAQNETYRIRNTFLQSLNQRVRDLIPGSPLRDALRAAYRQVNTDTNRPGLSYEETQTLVGLDAEFADDNRRLAAEFGVDVSPWTD